MTFRSSQPILTAVDCLFRHGDNASGLTFDDEAGPAPLGQGGAGGLVEVWAQIEPPAKDKNAPVNLLDDDEDEESRPEVELAEILADRISAGPGAMPRRAMRAGWRGDSARCDIMILMRSRSGPFIRP